VQTKTIKQHYTVVQHNTIKRKHNLTKKTKTKLRGFSPDILRCSYAPVFFKDLILNSEGWSIIGRGEWVGREAEHSSPFSTEVKNGGAVPPLPDTSSGRVKGDNGNQRPCSKRSFSQQRPEFSPRAASVGFVTRTRFSLSNSVFPCQLSFRPCSIVSCNVPV
jgi:hypothetical protein